MSSVSATSGTQAAARRGFLVSLGLSASSVLTACAHRDELGADLPASPPVLQLGEWREVRLPGKRGTEYRTAQKDGRAAIEAHAAGSASMLRRAVDASKAKCSTLEFSWWVPQLVTGANVSLAESEDAPARVLLAFGGDHGRLSGRNRMMFELAEALTGERPPYATLMYVWEAQAPVESLIVNPRTDRVRKIVVDSGVAQLNRWRDHRRAIAADFHRAFGEEPGPLQSVAVMTDADNTATTARAWYGPVTLI